MSYNNFGDFCDKVVRGAKKLAISSGLIAALMLPNPIYATTSVDKPVVPESSLEEKVNSKTLKQQMEGVDILKTLMKNKTSGYIISSGIFDNLYEEVGMRYFCDIEKDGDDYYFVKFFVKEDMKDENGEYYVIENLRSKILSFEEIEVEDMYKKMDYKKEYILRTENYWGKYKKDYEGIILDKDTYDYIFSETNQLDEVRFFLGQDDWKDWNDRRFVLYSEYSKLVDLVNFDLMDGKEIQVCVYSKDDYGSDVYFRDGTKKNIPSYLWN